MLFLLLFGESDRETLKPRVLVSSELITISIKQCAVISPLPEQQWATCPKIDARVDRFYEEWEIRNLLFHYINIQHNKNDAMMKSSSRN